MNLTVSEIAGLVWSQFWQLTILIVVVALLGATVFRRRPHLMHLLWVVVVVKSLIIPMWGSPTSVFSWLQPRETRVAAADNFFVHVPSPKSIAPAIPVSDHLAKTNTANTETIFTRKGLIITGFAVWGGGVAILLFLAIRRWVQIYQAIKRRSHDADDDLVGDVTRLAIQLGIKQRVRVIISESNFGPMVFHSLRPVVILPESLVSSMSSREMEPIITHELLHLRRGDTIFGALQFFAQVVWWFHPLMWWACRQANRLCERCCDDEVVANLECSPKDYARSLLDTLELRASLSAAPPLPGIRSKDVTLQRIKSIISSGKDRRILKSAPRRHWLYAIALAMLVFPGGKMIINAQEEQWKPTWSAESSDLKLQAECAAGNENWSEAVDAFRKLTVRNDSDVRARFMLGYCLHVSGKIDEAIVAHKRAATFDQSRAIALYNLACAHALKKDYEAAIKTLEQSINAGFSSYSIEEDPDFREIKDDLRFKDLVEAAKPNPDRKVYREFDFWIGNWDVFDQDGEKVGENCVTKDQQGFLLTEKWSNVDGESGTGINYFDPSEHKWKQTWVDTGGNIIRASGGADEGKMSFEGYLTRPSGVIISAKVTYAQNEDGSVRRLIEHSGNQGVTWSIHCDRQYVRKQVCR